MRLSGPGRPTTDVASDDERLASALAATLRQSFRDVHVDAGQLHMTFANGIALQVAPDELYEAWQISSTDGLLVVCGPGGDLTAWFSARGVSE